MLANSNRAELDARYPDVDEGQDDYEDIFGGFAEALKRIQSAVSCSPSALVGQNGLIA